MPWQPTSLHYPSVIVTPAWGKWQQHMRKMKMIVESQDDDVTWCLNPRVSESVANARILHPRPGNCVVMMAPLHREYSSPGHTGPCLTILLSMDNLNVEETLKKIYNTHGQLICYTHWWRGGVKHFVYSLMFSWSLSDLILSVKISMTQSQQSLQSSSGASRPSLADNCGIKRGYLQWPGAALNGLLASFVFWADPNNQ